jgi:hypothetical protein
VQEFGADIQTGSNCQLVKSGTLTIWSAVRAALKGRVLQWFSGFNCGSIKGPISASMGFRTLLWALVCIGRLLKCVHSVIHTVEAVGSNPAAPTIPFNNLGDSTVDAVTAFCGKSSDD